MQSGEGSTQTPQPTASAAEASTPPRRNTKHHFAVWARFVAVVVLVLSVVVVVFFAWVFTEREYGDLFASFEGSLTPAEDTCIQTFCSPAGRFGQHCRQHVVPC
jgi:hypothetical protein